MEFALERTILGVYTDKKENQIFLKYKEIQSGAVAKSYMRKGFLIYEEMLKYYPKYVEAVSHIGLCNCSVLDFLIYEENLIFFFISVLTFSRCTCVGRPPAVAMTSPWQVSPGTL